MSKSVTILSLGPSRTQCPFQTEELWGVYRCILEPDLQDKKFDKLFCVDGTHQSINDHQPIEIKSITKSLDKAKELHIPVVGLHRSVLQRSSEQEIEAYPIASIARKLKANTFGPTPAWMMAYAIYHGYERIEIYGIDQGPQLYYYAGKASMMYWIGYGVGAGVKMHLGPGSLRWCYSSDLAGAPEPFVREVFEDLYVKTVEDNERLANV